MTIMQLFVTASIGGMLIAGVFVIGVVAGLQINIKAFLHRKENKEKKKAIKKRDGAVYMPQMSDQEAKESDDNSVERINKEVHQIYE